MPVIYLVDEGGGLSQEADLEDEPDVDLWDVDVPQTSPPALSWQVDEPQQYEDDRYTCPRCGRSTDALFTVGGRDGTRHVCVDCERDAAEGDRTYWRWYWRGE
jgi:hypothetical protein